MYGLVIDEPFKAALACTNREGVERCSVVGSDIHGRFLVASSVVVMLARHLGASMVTVGMEAEVHLKIQRMGYNTNNRLY